MGDSLFTGVQMGDSFGVDAINNFFLAGGGLQIDYFLVMKVNGVKKAVLPLPEQPDSIQISDMFTETPIYTFDPNYAYREIGRARRRKVVLTGQVGTRRRLNMKITGVDGVSRPALVNETGEENLKNFEQFLRNYHQYTAGQPAPTVYTLAELENDIDYHAGKPYLEIKCFKEKLSGRCTVESFTYTKDAKSKRLGGYMWTLELMVYDDTKMEPPLGFTPFQEWADSLNNFLAAAEQFAAVLNGIADGVISETLGATGSVINNMRAVNAQLERLAKAPQRLTAAVDGLVADVLHAVNALYDSIASAVSFVYPNLVGLFTGDSWNFGRTQAAVNEMQARDWLFNEPVVLGVAQETGDQRTGEESPILIQMQSELRAAQTIEALLAIERHLALLGAYRRATNDVVAADSLYGFLESNRGIEALATLNPEQLSLVGQASEVEYRGSYEQYTMQDGENLLTVATRLLGSPEAWQTLARVNRCVDAYTMRDGSPIVGGTIILVPRRFSPMMHQLGRGTTLSETTGYEDQYGVDLYIDPLSGDLVLDYETGNAVVLSDGVDNLQQAIMIMIRTALGDITADHYFGTSAPSAIGSKFTENSAALILTDIEEMLKSDPRIVQVSNMSAVPHYTSNMLEISMDVLSYLGDTVRVRVPV